nr:PREDICTED: uncharacterized protein LOC100879426 [Megachile rotundata]
MFTVQTVSAIYNSAAVWGIETSCMTVILHVSGQFKLIKTWINNIGVKIKNEPKDHYYKCPPDIEDGLVRCIRHHQRLVNVVNELNDLLIPIIFIQLLTSGIKICLSGFAVMNNNTNAELIKAVLYLFGMTTQLLLYCYPGAGSLVLTIGQTFFKTAYLLTKKERACRLLDELRSLWNSTDDPVEKKSYEVFAYWGRTCTIAFFVSGMSTTSMFMISGVVDSLNQQDLDNISNRHLPYDVWHEMEYLESPEFELMYAGQIMASFICCFGVLRTLRSGCVVEDVNTLLAPIIFLQLLTGGMQICLSGFAVLSNNAGDNLIKFIAYLASVTIQIVMYCWPGEILIQESQKVGHAAYLNVPWYQLPLFHRRQLLLIIIKSQKYCCISALTFKSLSSHTLTNISWQLMHHYCKVCKDVSNTVKLPIRVLAVLSVKNEMEEITLLP